MTRLRLRLFAARYPNTTNGLLALVLAAAVSLGYVVL